MPLGVTGYVEFNEDGARDPAFVIRAIDSYDAYAVMGYIAVSENETVRSLLLYNFYAFSSDRRHKSRY